MIDKSKPYGEVFGVSGAAYEQTQGNEIKIFNKIGLEVTLDKNGLSATVIEELPEDFVSEEEEKSKKDNSGVGWKDTPSELTVHERIRVDEKDSPHYMDAEEIKIELDTRNVSYDKRMGRDKLIMVLKHELGE